MEKTAYLVLENGKIFKGKFFGNPSNVLGEVVFTTSMNGYIETLTDPNYFGQIVVQTFPLIGNYGVMPSDVESSDVKVSAYIVKSLCEVPSNFRSEGDLDTFFKEKNVTCLSGIDTRALTKILRENGSMNGYITDDVQNIDFDKIKSYKTERAVESVSCKEIYTVGEGEKNIVLYDFGVKNSVLNALKNKGYKIYVVPFDTPAEKALALSPCGIVLSNGGGNPDDNANAVENIKELLKSGVPIFGISLGHQLLALANGFETEKLKYGHHGANIPVKSTDNDRVYITSQNHCYAVSNSSIDGEKAEVVFYNVNDKSCEGLRYKNIPAFSTEFFPDSAGGLCDTTFVYNKFFEMMEGR